MITIAFKRGPIDGLELSIDLRATDDPKIATVVRCGEQDPGVYELDTNPGDPGTHIALWRNLDYRG